MNFPKPKSREEIHALDAALDRIRNEWHFDSSFGFAELLRHWQKFVREVGEGYQLSIHDFTFDLSMRDVIEEVKEAVPQRLQQEISKALAPWDESFLLATQPSAKPIEEVEQGAKDWWFRIPLYAGPELESYLIREGFRNSRVMDDSGSS